MEDPEKVLDFWPVESKGAALITARKRTFGGKPAAQRLEISEFSPEMGKDFVLHLIESSQHDQKEQDAAKELSEMLYGHALALTQMSALIDRRRWSVQRFLEHCKKNAQKLHADPKADWSHAGYQQTLATVFTISFQELGDNARLLIGVLSLLSPDDVPADLFKLPEDMDDVPVGFELFQDETA